MAFTWILEALWYSSKFQSYHCFSNFTMEDTVLVILNDRGLACLLFHSFIMDQTSLYRHWHLKISLKWGSIKKLSCSSVHTVMASGIAGPLSVPLSAVTIIFIWLQLDRNSFIILIGSLKYWLSEIYGTNKKMAKKVNASVVKKKNKLREHKTAFECIIVYYFFLRAWAGGILRMRHSDCGISCPRSTESWRHEFTLLQRMRKFE